MIQRSSFLATDRGFSLAGTLVAIAIGAIVAAITATLINEAVRGQRGIADRDELSEFTSFIRNVVNTDATCTAVLNQKTFPLDGAADLELQIGYGDQPTAVIKKGFALSGGNLEVDELTIEDRTPKGAVAQFKIGIADAKGKVTEQSVRRHMARIRLSVKSGDTNVRTRFFEVPVLYNTASKKIEMCNNEVNVGDACQALGFRWDASVSPAQCVPANTCLYGGAYTSRRNGTCGVADQNPATSACSCPAGADSPVTAGSVNISTNCAKGCDTLNYDTVVQCFLCPN